MAITRPIGTRSLLFLGHSQEGSRRARPRIIGFGSAQLQARCSTWNIGRAYQRGGRATNCQLADTEADITCSPASTGVLAATPCIREAAFANIGRYIGLVVLTSISGPTAPPAAAAKASASARALLTA